jgi:hypothetical protein
MEQLIMTSQSDQFELIASPPSISNIDPAILQGGHKIAYARHPAYQQFAEEIGLGDRFRAVAVFARSFLPLLVKRIVRYEIIPYDLRQSGGFAFAKAAIRNALRLDNAKPSAAVQNPLAQMLRQNGVGVVAIPKPVFASLEKAAAGHFERLVERRGASGNQTRAFEESRSSASRFDDSGLFVIIEQLFKDAGVLVAASSHLGRQVKLVDVNPQINDRSDSFWRDIFPDMDGAPLPTAAYYHRDASGGDLKAIIYMTDVMSEADGAFSYVVGSNRAAAVGIDDLICEANDHGLSATDPETRRVFAALPQKLQQKGSFGNDLSNNTRLAEEIAGSSWAITSDKGAIVLFDTKGVHRGGMVETGERRVITCVLG